MRFALFALLLAACTQTDEGAKKIQWVQLADVTTVCKDAGFAVTGCHRWQGDTCYVYTKQANVKQQDRPVQAALGEETRHCFEGDYHAGVDH